MSWGTEDNIPLAAAVLEGADLPTFLRDQPHLRIQDDPDD